MNARITVSLPEHLVEAAQAAVSSGRAASVSAYVPEAMTAKADAASLSEVLEAWRAEAGPPSDEETEWAERALGRTPASAVTHD